LAAIKVTSIECRTAEDRQKRSRRHVNSFGRVSSDSTCAKLQVCKLT
jgi:hypothetical protein